MDFPAKLQFLPEMLGFILKAASESRLDHHLLRKLELASEEVLVNIITHAYENQENKYLSVECRQVGQDDFEVVFQDDGPPFNPIEAIPKVDLTQSIDERPIGGLGIYLIHKLIDNVIYERKGEKNILAFRLKASIL